MLAFGSYAIRPLPNNLSNLETPTLQHRIFFIVLLTIISSSSGCYDPTAGKVDAGAEDAKNVATFTTQASDQVFLLDADNTDIKWTGSNVAGQTPYGYFYELAGKAIFSSESQRWRYLEVTIQMDSVKAMNPELTKKLKHSGFFEVDQFPQATFVSTNISDTPRPDDPPETTHVIEGNFQLRDITKSIQIPVQLNLAGGQLKLVSEFNINRRDYGVHYSDSTSDAAIRDNILINLEIQAPAAPSGNAASEQ